jgi:hypothetical protein
MENRERERWWWWGRGFVSTTLHLGYLSDGSTVSPSLPPVMAHLSEVLPPPPNIDVEGVLLIWEEKELKL